MNKEEKLINKGVMIACKVICEMKFTNRLFTCFLFLFLPKQLNKSMKKDYMKIFETELKIRLKKGRKIKK